MKGAGEELEILKGLGGVGDIEGAGEELEKVKQRI